MKKYFRRIMVCGLIALLCWSVFLIADRRRLQTGLIRFHVVAHSDSDADQEIKRNIRDVVLESIQEDIRKIGDIKEAREYLQNHLPIIQLLVERTLHDLGFVGNATVTLCKEQFDIRHYDTFSLPAGVYESLRIVIGDGLGHNWWCVSFPGLCIPATTVEFCDTAVGAGFSEPLVQSLSGNEEYEIHFLLLNQLGKLENYLFDIFSE